MFLKLRKFTAPCGSLRFAAKRGVLLLLLFLTLSSRCPMLAFFRDFLDDIAAIRARDPAARSAWEVATCYPGLQAIMMHRMAHAMWRKKQFWLARYMANFNRMFTGIEIHPAAIIGRRVFIDHGMGVVIGETAVVGDDCTLYHGATLGGTSLVPGSKRHPTLENGVIVGSGAKLLGGFTVGRNAKIGSNAVVVKAVPAGATVVGNPARLILRKETPLDAPNAGALPFGAIATGFLDPAEDTPPASPQTPDEPAPSNASAAVPIFSEPADAREFSAYGLPLNEEANGATHPGAPDDAPALAALAKQVARQQLQIDELAQKLRIRSND